ncbi:TNF receptor-associated factor 4-like [Oculina patagonica]
MEEETEVNGGYDFEFVDALPPCQSCSICFLAMRKPVQTKCGHRYCETCLLQVLRRGNHCPQDRNPIPKNGGFFADVAWERDILSLRVKCKRSERGCDWTEQLRDYEKHFRMCKYEDEVCDACDEVVERRFLQQHNTAECLWRIVQCEYCQKKFAFFRTEIHRNKCLRFPLDCPQQCGVREIPRQEVETHVKNDCLLTMVACPYEEAGCNFHDKRSTLKAHLEVSTEDHLRKTWSKLQNTTNALEDVEEAIVQLEEDKKSLKRSLERERSDRMKLEVKNGTLKKEVNKLKYQLDEVKLTAAENQKFISLMKPHVLGPKAIRQSMKVEKDRCHNPVKGKQKRKYRDTDYSSSQSDSDVERKRFCSGRATTSSSLSSDEDTE